MRKKIFWRDPNCAAVTNCLGWGVKSVESTYAVLSCLWEEYFQNNRPKGVLMSELTKDPLQYYLGYNAEVTKDNLPKERIFILNVIDYLVDQDVLRYGIDSKLRPTVNFDLSARHTLAAVGMMRLITSKRKEALR
ncbi:MAG: hypothetical protein LUB62_03625 [Prevotellaceae bacterium]|nr:hypothetical protein [Prevotellaceae bacterium]